MRDISGCGLLVRRRQRRETDAAPEEATHRLVRANRRRAITQRAEAALVGKVQPLGQGYQPVRPAQWHRSCCSASSIASATTSAGSLFEARPDPFGHRARTHRRGLGPILGLGFGRRLWGHQALQELLRATHERRDHVEGGHLRQALRVLLLPGCRRLNGESCSRCSRRLAAALRRRS